MVGDCFETAGCESVFAEWKGLRKMTPRKASLEQSLVNKGRAVRPGIRGRSPACARELQASGDDVQCPLLSCCRGAGVGFHVRRGDTIYYPDQAAEYVYTLQQGLVALFNLSADGDERIASIVTPGDVFGLIAMREQVDLLQHTLPGSHKYFYHAVAVTNATLCKVKASLVEGQAKADPAFSWKLNTLLRHRLHTTMAVLSFPAHGEADRRLVALLLVLAERIGRRDGGSIVIDTKLSHCDLADLACLSRPRVTIALIRLRSEGLIRIENGRLRLLNPGALAERLV